MERAKSAAANRAVAEPGRASEDGFKRRVSSRIGMVLLMDGILPKKDAFSG